MSDQDEVLLGGVRKELVAALHEMQFWLRIMQEHAGLIRNGLDPTEERLFREADMLFRELAPLRAEAESLMSASPGKKIGELIERSLIIVSRLRDFKRNITALIKECRILTILPTDLIDHVRREADFFLGELHYVRGEPTPAKETIGIPDARERALTVPRLLIPDLAGHIDEIALEASLFWLRQNMEHADVLALYFRPGVQEKLVQITKSHAARLHEVYNEALEVNRTGSGLDRLLARSRRVVGEWDDFLRRLFNALVHCSVPTGQINTFPVLDDHMSREAQYYLDVLHIVGRIRRPHGMQGHSH